MNRFMPVMLIVVLMSLSVLAGATVWLPTVLPPIAAHAAGTAVPALINHQGVVSVNGARFTGSGAFRFALIDPDTGNNVWTNDGSQIGGSSMPTTSVTVSVTDGVYAALLGDTNLTNMTAVPAALFTDDNLRLRVWFDDGLGHGTQLLTPDHTLASSPYAFMASDILDDAVTAEKLDPSLGVWGKSGSNLFYTGGNVGINTSSPNQKLEVTGNIHANSGTVRSAASDRGLAVALPGDIEDRTIVHNAGDIVFGDGTGTFDIAMARPAAGKFAITGGKVGIGTTNPTSNLHVNGSIMATTGTIRSSYTDRGLAVSMPGDVEDRTVIRNPGELVFGNGAGTFDIYLSRPAAGKFAITGADVGIGTTTPTSGYKLDVAGNLRCQSLTQYSSREYKKDIEPVHVAECQTILQRLDETKLYRYRYQSAEPDTPARIGFIAEEAPRELLSPEGKGVDLGQTVACLVAGLQAQQEEIRALREEVRQLRLEREQRSQP